MVCNWRSPSDNSVFFLAAAHGISGPPPVSVADRPGHVASGEFAVISAETLRAPAVTACVLVISFLKAAREGSAAIIIALPLLGVVMRVGLEAFVIGSTEGLRLPGAALIGVPVASVVSAGVEAVGFVSGPPGDVAG